MHHTNDFNNANSSGDDVQTEDPPKPENLQVTMILFLRDPQ